MQAAHFAANQIVKKETLYNGNHDLGNGMYNVEMLISQTDDLVISAQHTELPDSFIIEIESIKVSHLVNEFSNDYESMAKHLKIMNKRMVLLNPVSTFGYLTFFRNSSRPRTRKKQRRRSSKTSMRK